MRKNNSLRPLCESAVFTALALALSYLKIPTGMAFGGFGGSLSLVMIPLVMCAIRWGLGWGLGAGLAFGTLKYFFSSGVTGSDGEGVSSNSIKSMIKEIIDGEDSKNPYSDQDMVAILSERGIEISRRTVAKYREGLNILSSSKRRRY